MYKYELRAHTAEGDVKESGAEFVRHQESGIKSRTVNFNSDFRSVYFANHFTTTILRARQKIVIPT